jgi:hypothetical protein
LLRRKNDYDEDGRWQLRGMPDFCKHYHQRGCVCCDDVLCDINDVVVDDDDVADDDTDDDTDDDDDEEMMENNNISGAQLLHLLNN